MILMLCLFALAFCYAAFVGFSLVNFVVGLVLAVLVLIFLPQIPRSRSMRLPSMQRGVTFGKFVFNVLHFFFDFIVDLTLSNFQIAYEVLTPTDSYDARLIYVPAEDLTDLELVLLSSRITLTPGTLSADVTADRRYLIVHVMYSKGEDENIIAQRLRKPIQLLRR